MANFKTNAMRLLDKAGIPYRVHTYTADDGVPDGETVATKIGMPAERVFKTLVTVGSNRNPYIFVLPVTRELDLKAAARAVDEKALSMLKVTDLEKTTGYVRGGCSPLGMKKDFPVCFDEAAGSLETMVVSAGKIGFQVEVAPAALLALCRGKMAAIVMPE